MKKVEYNYVIYIIGIYLICTKKKMMNIYGFI